MPGEVKAQGLAPLGARFKGGGGRKDVSVYLGLPQGKLQRGIGIHVQELKQLFFFFFLFKMTKFSPSKNWPFLTITQLQSLV